VSDRRIAIIGAGGTGTCAALELASRGHTVDLFERRAEAVSEASFVNEGKIHLGFIYALDARMRTAARMIEGALRFEENLRRWIPFRAADVVSTPFNYCVHRGSLLEPDSLARYYDRCCALYRERAAASGRDYLGLGAGCSVARLKREEYEELVDPAYFTAVFRTTERAVDPRAIAVALRQALLAEPRIRFRPKHRVLEVAPRRRGGCRLAIDAGGSRIQETFTDVVNAAWYERLALDLPLGIEPPGRWSHRYKFGNRVAVRLRPDAIPSCTVVQGPFGDIVNFGERGLFLSWYPIGRTGMSTAEVAPDWHTVYSPAERHDVFSRSLAEWRKHCPRLAGLPDGPEQVDAAGGVIYALGTTDVDDESSDLHHRYEIGIQTRGRYHSVDTGKYTLVPYWGRRVADRVEGLDA
jgi:NAD(P)-dependent dehydrogenase (short-subunit alcohol dehydrogenase family)